MTAACGLALLLMVDVSISVDKVDYEMQVNGLASAFEEERVLRAFQDRETVAVSIVEWAEKQIIQLPWTIVRDKQDLQFVVNEIRHFQRPKIVETGLYTHIGKALDFALNYIDEAPCVPEQVVIDVSGDGIDNGDGVEHVREARDRAQSLGYTINGLSVQDQAYASNVDPMAVYNYYRENVATYNGFVVMSEGFEKFAQAMVRKLVMEISWNNPR